MGGGVDGAKAARELLASDERLRKKIFAFAYDRTKELNAAKDLAHEAIVRVIDPERSPWDPAAQPKLLNHVGSVMNSLVANRRRGEMRHPFVRHEPERDRRVDGAPSPEARLLEVEDHSETMAQLRFWMDELRARLEGDALALGKIALLYEGVDDADAQAARLGCARRDVYRANERIAYHVNLVKRAGHKPPPHDTRGFVALAAPSEESESEP
jgi:DNA-directed RNA polymerase specialized sigma24 family protein